MLNEINMQEYCDKISEAYSKFIINKINEVEYKFLLKYAKKSSNILDLCCGPGRYLIPFSKLGYNIEGIDFSKKMIYEAKLNAKEVKIKIEKGDARNIPRQNATYDIVILFGDSIGTLPSNEERHTTIKECSRVLKKKGMFICTIGDRNSNPIVIMQTIKNYIMNFHKDIKSYGYVSFNFSNNVGKHYYHSMSEFKKLLKKAGFSIIEIQRGKADTHHKVTFVCKKTK